jgi:hypothetical protein
MKRFHEDLDKLKAQAAKDLEWELHRFIAVCQMRTRRDELQHSRLGLKVFRSVDRGYALMMVLHVIDGEIEHFAQRELAK